MNDDIQNQPNNLEQPERVAATGLTDSCQDACDEILTRIREGGLPVTINASRVQRDPTDPQSVEINAIGDFIRSSRIVFNEYKKVMDDILNCDQRFHQHSTGRGRLGPLPNNNNTYEDECGNTQTLPQEGSENVLLTEKDIEHFRFGALFSSSKSYSILKYATEKFVNIFLGLDRGDIADPPSEVLPYVKLIEAKLSDVCCCECDIKFRPLFAELIWNYWLEEGMMVHTINAIGKRFQNKRSANGKDPLSHLSLDPLRPLNNLVWGYIQDTMHRLTPTRRAYEYYSAYGIAPFATGVSKLNVAESNSFFIQAFHNLLYKCAVFYREADNLFKVPDAFPVLNALREVHLLLSEGAGNQFGDLPITSRAEMMLEQYILARPEIREFLGGRIMVPYDEAWMDRVDTMKSVQGWPGASISYYRDLAVYGEEILLSIRWISWTQINNRDIARDWALTFRDAVQRYIHCYQAVTGVDLSATEVMGPVNVKAVMPAVLIRRKAQRDLVLRRR
jgi:hypothetical protein